MAISDWPADLRPREKLLNKGATSLSDAELLAIFLRTGIKGKSAVELAQDLITEGKGLRGLISMDVKSFCGIKGMGEAKFVQLQAVMEMARRHMQEELVRGDSYTSAEQSSRYIQSRLRDYPYEVFACMFLDSRHRLIEFEEMFRGTIDGASVYCREIVRKALEHNAAATILAHNHPSGVAEPSEADRHITERITNALKLIDVTVLDHIVVGDDVVSMAARGYL